MLSGACGAVLSGACGAVLSGACGAVAARWAAARPQGWVRTNHRGAPVSLAAGPAVAVAGALTARLPPVTALAAGVGAGLIGRYDDVAGGPHAKGLRGHLGALTRGEVTSGAVKLAALSGLGLVAGRPLTGTGPDRLLAGALVAGGANLVNLLDLRPGRALKVAVPLALCTGQVGLAGVAAAQLPGDLAERTMLGDAGANALGALLAAGVLARWPGRAARLVALALVVGLTGLSERRSFSTLIDGCPPLRAADRWGRRPPTVTAPAPQGSS